MILGQKTVIVCVLIASFGASLAWQPIKNNRPNALSNKLFSSPSDQTTARAKLASDDFLTDRFNTDINDVNLPPSLVAIRRSIGGLAQGSDIRGSFCDHKRLGSVTSIGRAIKEHNSKASTTAVPLTPMAAYCLGYSFATMMLKQRQALPSYKLDSDNTIVIGMGLDPRSHGRRLADAFSRGAESVHPNVQVMFTGLATTPAMYDFCRSSLCDGAVMVTASHLPTDRNGFKFFSRQDGGFTKADIGQLIETAKDQSLIWYDLGSIPPTSGEGAVFCSQWVDWMPIYEGHLAEALCRGVGASEDETSPLKGLNVVLNSGHGAGGFFAKVLDNLGADISGSIHVNPDPTFPAGYVPNPESEKMVQATIAACEAANADIGILLDTDADRCGFVVPSSKSSNGKWTDYQVLNRNRLIALLAVVFSEQSPGCAFVTDSVTSQGLADFLKSLDITHVRYLKGYANVIGKAKELSESGTLNAEVAIETSGHCAMKENGYSDDGTYTAVKILGFLVNQVKAERLLPDNNQSTTSPLLQAISNLSELPEVAEFRIKVPDNSLSTMGAAFKTIEETIWSKSKEAASLNWTIDEDNLEGIRVNVGSDGSFFMLRKSLHDPVLCLQVEAESSDAAKKSILDPLMELMTTLDCSAIAQYC